MLWEVDIHPLPGQPDLVGRQIASAAAELHLLPADQSGALSVAAARGYLIQANYATADAARVAQEVLADRVVEQAVVAPVGDASLHALPDSRLSLRESSATFAERKATARLPDGLLVHVLLKPGVTDPVAQSVMGALADYGLAAEAVRTFKKYWIAGLSAEYVAALGAKLLANDAIEQVIVGPLTFDHLALGSAYHFQLTTVPIRTMDDAALVKLSREGQLYLSLVEMQTIRSHFCELYRDPTDAELETIAQTWSEHCSHKTLAGRIRYRDEHGERTFLNMLRETIFAATEHIRHELGLDDWCVSVFKDNAGVIRFDDQYNVVFKVETHNHPSALEPYGGANTGLGGVIRDPMGTGMGAKPICNTDVFCFAPPDTPPESLPAGVLHPRRVAKGVVSGVRDYGNRMGIPTVNGAVYFDSRYLGNPLVFCGNVGLLPVDKSSKETLPGDMIVAIGGRTGRDGIHGATFSSAELTHQSETLSGGAVQIGNAITEKMVLDVLMAARDRNLYTAVTDCGAGGFSSAVGEMGEDIGAEVWLDRCPLKYEGLSYTEIWISEAQERMVVSVPAKNVDELVALCASEGVEASVIGQFKPTGRLVLKYGEQQVADLSMEFLHDGRPPVVREAIYLPWHGLPAHVPLSDHEQDSHATDDTVRIRQGANLPHWTREGGVYAINFRLADSLPQQVLEAWKLEREESIGRLKQVDQKIDDSEAKRIHAVFSEKIEKYLDAGHGKCWMRQPEIATLVENALKYFDGERYRLIAWCVMPNHVHVVVKPNSGYELHQIVHSWKSYTANEANRLLKRDGAFWQPEPYDHLIRDDDDLVHAVEYLLSNPEAAGLKNWKWVGCVDDILASVDEGGMGFQPMSEAQHGQDGHATEEHGLEAHATYTADLHKILASYNVCSKHWIIRQYDHEVQAGSVVKPLVGVNNDGPSDAAVVRPVLGSRRGIVISCGMNPRYGDFDPYWMAASAIDEAVRNCVAVGGDPRRIAILDNFCWGNTDRPETLGSLVRAALACHDVAIALGTPFISGKDSLNNEFRPHGGEPIAIPPSLLISAIGQVKDVSRCVTMDLKEAGNVLFVVGQTHEELGGSHWHMVRGLSGGAVPKLDAAIAKTTFLALHHAIDAGLVRACHDLSEGGLATAIAEMAFAGGLGATIDVETLPTATALSTEALLFSESNTRFLCEVRPQNVAAFKAALADVTHAELGRVVAEPQLTIRRDDKTLIAADLSTLKTAWQRTLDW